MESQSVFQAETQAKPFLLNRLPGAVPALPVGARRGIPVPLPVDGDEPAVGVLISNTIHTSPVPSYPAPTVKVQNQRSLDIVAA